MSLDVVNIGVRRSQLSISLLGSITFTLYTTLYIFDFASLALGKILSEILRTNLTKLFAQVSFFLDLVAFWSGIILIILVLKNLATTQREQRGEPFLKPPSAYIQQAAEFSASLLYYTISGIMCMVFLGFYELIIYGFLSNRISILPPLVCFM